MKHTLKLCQLNLWLSNELDWTLNNDHVQFYKEIEICPGRNKTFLHLKLLVI